MLKTLFASGLALLLARFRAHGGSLVHAAYLSAREVWSAARREGRALDAETGSVPGATTSETAAS